MNDIGIAIIDVYGQDDLNACYDSIPEGTENVIVVSNTRNKLPDCVKKSYTSFVPELKKWLEENYEKSIKSVSFLLRQNHGFKQAPFEEITKEQYDELIKKVIPITSGKIKVVADNELSSDCVGGACPIR